MSTHSTTVTGSDVLHRLLDAELAFSPVIHEHFSSHLAMELAALHRMGAPDVALRRSFDRGAAESEPRDDGDDLARRVEEVERNGIHATLAARAPGLVDAPGTALFHPVIRLGYALDIHHPGQVAAALLDWERRREAPPAAPERGPRRLPDIAAALRDGATGTRRHTFDFEAVARRPEVRGALAGAALDERTVDDLSSFALAAHVSADDFVTLHLVTGARAVRTLRAWLDDDPARRLVEATRTMVAVAYAAVGAPPLLDASALDALRNARLPSREQIAQLAVTDRDPHVIKLADVALAEERRTGDLLYRYAAGHVVGLLPAAASLPNPSGTAASVP